MSGQKPAYHHGNLRAALIAAALELTRDGGVPALGIREVTRRVGVSPNAAYRHFADRQALLDAVKEEIQRRMVEQMHSAHKGRARASPRDRLRAVGLGYIDFALAEPGWFAVAFFGGGSTSAAASAAPPYRALVAALDEMVESGDLSPAEREGAEWACWSSVHGFAELALHGPLRETIRADLEGLAARTVDAIIAGLPRGV